MKIDRVTLTGADYNTRAKELWELYLRYPFVEWGILFSKNREGTPRYPPRSTILEFIGYDMKLSAHFCGWYSQQILEKKSFELLKYWDAFPRFQINYNFSKSTGWDIRPLIEWASLNPQTKIILQANGANQKTIDYVDGLDTPENIHFLYDSSGGRGKEILEIKSPYKNYTGYSGGLSFHNIETVCKHITDYPNPVNVWIDMESGVRTGDNFDTSKAGEILEICKQFVESKEPHP